MLDAGIGETKLNTLMSAINVPTISQTSLKRYERFVGTAIQELADISCKNAIDTEKKLTLEHANAE